MRSRWRFGFAVAAMLCSSAARTVDADPDQPLPEFTATYQVRAMGLRGQADMRLSYEADTNIYLYESRTQAHGIAKLIRRHPVIETTRFNIDQGRIRPLEYALDDGSKKGERNARVDFDWSAGLARSIYKGESREIELEAGMQDRMSLQLSIMQDLRTGDAPSVYTLAERNDLKRYEYTFSGEEEIEVPAGRFATIKYRRQREGSSRSSIIWFAPELCQLPVQVEQLRKGKRRGTMQLREVSGLDC